MNRISSNYEENVQWFNDVLGAGRSCDMVCRDLYVGGQRTHSDVALCYLDDRVDHALLDELRHKLQNIQANSLTMAQESVAEAIRPKQWYNPFPKVRYTERPDTAAACVMEGSIILMVDNSAAVMILPTTFFDFTQEANDFYFPPLVGTYLRALRVTVFLISLLITPAWYLMVSSPGRGREYGLRL